MAWTTREAVATAACLPAGMAALLVAYVLDSLDVDPDLILALGATIAALLVVVLAFAARVARPRFFVIGLPLAMLAYWATWAVVAAWVTSRTHG